MDSDQSGAISYEEFQAIIQNASQERLDYFAEAFFLANHVYSGLGMDPSSSGMGDKPQEKDDDDEEEEEPVAPVKKAASSLAAAASRHASSLYKTYPGYYNPIKRGWFEDLASFCANNHPVLRLFYSDKGHPYRPVYAGVELAGALITSACGAGLMLHLEESGINYAVSLLLQVRFVEP